MSTGGRGRVLSGPLLDTSLAPTLVFTTAAAPPSSRDVWEKAGVEVCEVGEGAGGEGVSLDQARALVLREAVACFC